MSRFKPGLSSFAIFSILALGVLFGSEVVLASFKPPIPLAPGEPENNKISYSDGQWQDYLELPDEKGAQKRFTLRGEQWSYKTILGDSQEAQEKVIREWLANKDCDLLADADGQILARSRSATGEQLTYYFKISSDKSLVSIYKTRLLDVDHPVTMIIGGEGREWFSLWVDHDGRQYQSLVVEFEKKDVSFDGVTRARFGEYERTVHHNHVCRIEHGSRQVVFDLPQYAGHYRWKVFTHAKQPQKVRISLEKGPTLPELKDGERLGALRVRNLPSGSVQLKAEWDASMDHPNFGSSALQADRTPEGAAIFWVPSGYWQIEGTPQNQDGLRVAKAHMIPVHTGRTTLVDWPRSQARTFAPKAAGRLEILDARQHQERAEVDISLMELDDAIIPRPERVQCYEGGQPGRVVSVEPLKSPLHVVLLLDSSGSMKGSMTQAVEATKSFVIRFPETTQLTIVDFDTKPKILKAANHKELLQALDGVRANGATSLFDSMLLGLDQLKAESRRALVVFTDGVDANYNDTGPGSKATKDQVMKAVEGSGTPIFTIGFGQKPDVDTLTRVADLSGGSYYEAHDKSSLDEVFAKISANLGRQYRVTYERPPAVGLSDVPVMALVVDNSGSMDKDPDRKGCDFRIVKVQQILKDFTHAFPENFLVQLLTFSSDTRVNQLITSEKAFLLRGLSMMRGEGGTDILGSVRSALQTLKTVPSTRRYLVYLTDAAMKVDKDKQKEFDILLSSLRDEGIKSLFIGVVDNDEDGAFNHAATMSGGKYVISTDLDKVRTAFDELANQVAKPTEQEERIALRLTLADRNDKGRNRLFSAGRFVDFSKRPEAALAASPEALAWSIGDPLTVYDDVVGQIIAGDDLMLRDVRVSKRIPLQVSGSNQAMTLSAQEMIFLSRLKGLDPPSGYRYLAIPLEMTNRLKSQKVAVYRDGSSHPAAWVAGSAAPVRYEQAVPPYLIPDLTSHLFLRWNQEATLPVSPATWLSREPLLLPGERALTISPGQPVKGACVFLVPDGIMTQASLHYYDVNYGNIDLPLTGVIPTLPEKLTELPAQPDKKLGESFSLRMAGVGDQRTISQINAEEGYVFRVVEVYLTSKIQALLAVSPAERFSYHLPMSHGELVFELHPATQYLPLGFYRPTMVAPGARNLMRMAFRVPEKLAAMKDKGFLFVDVQGGGVRLDLAESKKQPADLGKPDFSSNGVDVFVNETGVVKEKIAGERGNFIAVDVTFRDQADSSHTRIGPLLVLKKKGSGAINQQVFQQRLDKARYQAATKKHRGLGDFGETGVSGPAAVAATGVCRAQAFEKKLIFGLDENSVIFDGQTRRGVIVFKLPEKEKVENWQLSSLFIDSTVRPVQVENFADKELLAERLAVEDSIAERFWSDLGKKVTELQASRAATGYERPGRVTSRPVSLETADLGKQPLAVPGTVMVGARRLKEAAGNTDVLKLVAALRYVPGRGSAWSCRYAPEAVLTQGWGDSSDLARLAERLLNDQGMVTKRAEVRPTDQGKKALAKLANVSTVNVDSLSALRFEERDGHKHFVVFPWCRELEELDDLVKWDGSLSEPYDRREKIRIHVELELQAVGSESRQSTRMAADALSGGASKNKRLTVLDEYYRDDEASSGTFDIGYTEALEEGHSVLKCILGSPLGRRVGEKSVPLNAWTIVNERITISMDGRKSVSEQPVDAKHPITGRFHVLAVNSPDLDEKEAHELQADRTKIHDATSSPDGLSALRWYGQGIIDRFIAAQTRYERRLAGELGLTVGRTLNGRCILVSMQKADANSDLSTYMDLLYVANDIHTVEDADNQRAIHAFAILSGLTAARVEAAAIPDGLGVFELWERCPKGTQLVYIDNKNKKPFLEMLEKQNYPQALIERLKDCRSAMLFPSNPAVTDTGLRWGWLEIDPKTYRVVSRLDNGTAGALVETLLDDIHMQAGTYLVGALVGIDASIWSVSAFSLELEDFDEICEKAEKFAMNLGKRFSMKDDTEILGLDVGGTPSAEYSFDRYVKFSLDFSGFKKSHNLLGFGNGYKDAVEFYFSQFD